MECRPKIHIAAAESNECLRGNEKGGLQQKGNRKGAIKRTWIDLVPIIVHRNGFSAYPDSTIAKAIWVTRVHADINKSGYNRYLYS